MLLLSLVVIVLVVLLLLQLAAVVVLLLPVVCCIKDPATPSGDCSCHEDSHFDLLILLPPVRTLMLLTDTDHFVVPFTVALLTTIKTLEIWIFFEGSLTNSKGLSE